MIFMNRKGFIKTGLVATGTILLPNPIWSFGQGGANKFLSAPNPKRFKVSDNGIKFFETELSVVKNRSAVKLERKYFIAEDVNGLGTPTLLENEQQESFVFIPELYTGNKYNGYIVKLCTDGLCEENKIFTHEHQGFYAFWGKEYLEQPTLYHYNAESYHLMRMHRENGRWINHRVMQMYPNEMEALYQQQLKQVTTGQLTQQFGYDFEIHKDGFYDFLALKHGWEQSIITKEKEAFEAANPARVYSSVADAPIKISNTYVYTDPFIPIWCKGDDFSHAIIKPTIFYEEVVDTKILIPNMPAYKTQDGLGECRAFALAALLQWRTCKIWKSDIPDCKNPPPDSAISYFGLLAYTNGSEDWTESFEPLQDHNQSMLDIIKHLATSGSKLILESCKPFENLINGFPVNTKGHIKRDEYFNYLKTIFEHQKGISGKKDYSEEILKINRYVDLKVDQSTLKKALTKGNFNKFLYTLFFSDCKSESFPSGYRGMAYPLDGMNVTQDDIINQIKVGLESGNPVMYTGLCINGAGNECLTSHAIVISGYKKVYQAGNSSKTFDVVKLHNSWGSEWQLQNNDGWVDATTFVQNTAKVKNGSGFRFGSGTVLWLG